MVDKISHAHKPKCWRKVFLNILIMFLSRRQKRKCILSFGCFPGVCILCANVSEHSVRSIFIGGVGLHNLWRWNWQSVPKRPHIKFRSRGITQKKEYNIQNTAKVWNQEEKLFGTDKYQSHIQYDVFLIFPQTWLRPFTVTRCLYITILSQLPLMKQQ